MKNPIRFFFTLACTVFAASTFARPATQAELSAIDAQVEVFVKALADDDFEAIADVSIAPKVWDAISMQMGLEIVQARPKIVSQFENIMSKFEMANVKFNTKDVELADTKNLIYGYFPYSFDMTMNGATSSIDTSTLALFDEGEWYLLRVDPQQLWILTEAYPELQGLKPPRTLVEEN